MQSALEELLQHPLFSNSKRYPKLLRYVVDQTLEGRGDEIKERTIGVEAFGRSPDYDTNLDTVVRFSAAEVRKRLAVYYRDSRDVPIEIRLTARSYHVELLRFPEPEAAPAASEPGPDVSASAGGQTPPHAPGRKRVQVAEIAAFLVLLLVTGLGLYLWQRARNDAVNRFWKPLIEQRSQTTISLGGIVVSSPPNASTLPAPAASAVNPYLSLEDGLAMERVASLINSRGGSFRVERSSGTTIAEIRESPVVLVGAFNNDWTCRLAAPLRFHFALEPNKQIVDAQTPGRVWMRDPSRPFNDSPDYALVARFRNASTNSTVLLIAGLQRFGTDAASQFVTSADQLEALDRLIGFGWQNRNVEVVLKVDVVNGRAGAPSIVAAHAW